MLEANSMVQCAKKLILSNNELFFIDDVDSIRNTEFDLIFANSSLKYTPGPNLYPKWLLEMRAKYLYITRTLLSEKGFYHFPQISKLQEHGPGELDSKTKYKMSSTQISIVLFKNFKQNIESDYEIKLRTQEEKSSFQDKIKLLIPLVFSLN